MSQAPPSTPPRFTNRLAEESSPYLRQHAHNPVDWYPWGDEALGRARRDDRPILLSIGYSACHWCHVMAHESFEDEATAELMNQHFVNIKVDREERPDLDEVYMNAVQLMTRHGGWPMTVFLTPDLEPFFGGTYFPPDDRHGMPSFRTVLQAMNEAYTTQRTEVAHNAKVLVEEMRRLGAMRSHGEGGLDRGLLDRAYAEIGESFDPRHGGFGRAPKFPSPMSLAFCLRTWRASGDASALHIATHTLEKMAAGGIHDHLGGGFHRYSVDDRWLVPHFEKMLYDNALLVRLYLETWQATGREPLRRTAEDILGYIRRDMTDPGGGFYSSEDADSEGEEGKFYVWTPGTVAAVIGSDEGEVFCRGYEVSDGGNFEHGNSILNLPRPIAAVAAELGIDAASLGRRLAAARAKLFAARASRPRPFRDQKVLLAWNGLMLSSLTFAARVLGNADYLAQAVKSGEFLWREMGGEDRLRHTWMDGKAKIDAYLDDVAGFGGACLELYQATFDPIWLGRARSLGDRLLGDFEDVAGGGFWFTAEGGERLIARSKSPYDNAVPGGNSLAVDLALRLAALTGEERYAAAAARALTTFRDWMARAPLGFANLLAGLEGHLGGFTQLVVVGPAEDAATRALLAAASTVYHPSLVIARIDPALPVANDLEALAAGKRLVEGRPAAYVCRGFTCERPVLDPAELIRQLRARPAGEPEPAGA